MCGFRASFVDVIVSRFGGGWCGVWVGLVWAALGLLELCSRWPKLHRARIPQNRQTAPESGAFTPALAHPNPTLHRPSFLLPEKKKKKKRKRKTIVRPRRITLDCLSCIGRVSPRISSPCTRWQKLLLQQSSQARHGPEPSLHLSIPWGRRHWSVACRWQFSKHSSSTNGVPESCLRFSDVVWVIFPRQLRPSQRSLQQHSLGSPFVRVRDTSV